MLYPTSHDPKAVGVTPLARAPLPDGEATTLRFDHRQPRPAKAASAVTYNCEVGRPPTWLLGHELRRSSQPVKVLRDPKYRCRQCGEATVALN